MSRRSAAQARFLGLWSAGWLAVLLVLGMLRFGDPAGQWPVLLVPALWALVALRPRRRRQVTAEDPGEPEDVWPPYEEPPPPPPGMRTDTVERPALRRRDDDRW